MRIGIIEDNAHFIDQLKFLLKESKVEHELVFIGHSVDDAKYLFTKVAIDLAILDINIQGGNVFDALYELEEVNFSLLFTSSFEEFAVKAFKFSAVDFLVKPLDDIEFFEALNTAKVKIDQKNAIEDLKNKLKVLEGHLYQKEEKNKITISTDDGVSIILIKDILYLKAEGAYCIINLQDGDKLMVSKTMKYYADILIDEGFIKPHKSFVVNKDCVKKVSKGEELVLTLSNDINIPVSRRRKTEVISALAV